jgi:hypothetical protein
MMNAKKYANNLFEQTKKMSGVTANDAIVVLSCMGVDMMIEISKENNQSSKVEYLNKVKKELKKLAK